VLTLELHQIEERYRHLRVRDPVRVSRLAGMVATEGQRSPVLVVPAEESRYVLIDGYLRLDALRQLDRDTVRALSLSLDETDGLVLGHQKQHPRSALEEAWLVRELVECHGLALEEVARRLERSRRWARQRWRLLEELPESLHPLLADGRVPADAATRYLLPLARRGHEQAEVLVRNLGRRRWTVRELGRVSEALSRARDDAARLCILESPELYARVLEEEERADKPTCAGEAQVALLKDLRVLGAISRRARATLARVRPGTRQVDAALRRARSVFRVLLDEIQSHLAGEGEGAALQSSAKRGGPHA
jgi:ParB/RepB/Spo0J family partition protein